MADNNLKKLVEKIAPQLTYRHFKERIPFLEDRSVAFFVDEKWNLALLCEFARAIRFRRQIQDHKLKRVFVFSYSRSGTHNFVSRFHYFPWAFCLREHAFESAFDPFQAKVKPGSLKASHFLSLSMFRENGLQEKSGRELSHVFFLNNRYLEYPHPVSFSDFDFLNDKVIFYVRNIFRTLYSRDKSSQRIGKPKPRFKMTDERFEFSLRQHRFKLKEMLRLKQAYPCAVSFCFHEVFCAQPAVIMKEVCKFLDVSVTMLGSWNTPQSFFRRCFGDSTSPIIKDGKLWCSKRQNFMLGTGGKFNPLSYPSLERTMKDPVKTLLTPSRYKLAVEIFGRELVDFWLKDKNFPYSRETANRIEEMITNVIGAADRK